MNAAITEPRARILARALRLEYLTVGWNVVEGVIALGAAIAAGSVVLVGFGVDSFVESSLVQSCGWRGRSGQVLGSGVKSDAVEPEAWIEPDGLGKLDERMFVARAVRRSMEPVIHDGDFLVFRSQPVGTRQNKIVLAQYRGPTDPETGGAFTVKKYSSEKRPDKETSWRHTRIMLSPFNREYQPILIPEDQAQPSGNSG